MDGFENKHTKRDNDSHAFIMEQEALHAIATEQVHLLRAFSGDRLKRIIKGANKKRKREKAVGSGKTQPPKGFNEAFFGPKAKE